MRPNEADLQRPSEREPRREVHSSGLGRGSNDNGDRARRCMDHTDIPRVCGRQDDKAL